MTTDLRRVLADLAEQSRPLNSQDHLWRRGRRLRRRRRFTATLGGLLALLALAALPIAWRATPGPVQAADGRTAVLPSSFGLAWSWQQFAERSPNGPAMLTFVEEQRPAVEILPEPPATLIGQDGSYRTTWRIGGRLSPDGRLMAVQKSIIDLTSGRTVTINEHEYSTVRVLDWSPQGTEVLVVVDPYPVEGQPDAVRVVVVDAASGRGRTLLPAGVDPLATDSEGMFSPDGSKIALVLRRSAGPQQVTIVDAADGTVRATMPLTDRQRLAGWTPDGTNLVLVAAEVCDWFTCTRNLPSRQHVLDARARQRWHLQFADPATRDVVDEPRTGRPGWPDRLVGWYGRDSVWIVDDHEIDAIRPGEPARRLSVADGRVQQLDVASDLVKQGRFGGPAIHAPVWPPNTEGYWLLGISTVVVAAALLLVVLLVRRRRRPLAAAKPESSG
ncbi:hypothetical protein KZZ52_26630 [Dactylosporangium sp. AC04546]|uniref:hypothetical protein n=1 Tax=Dactylosporangium sp. AC04546 TaxID=2862460 RepID=UPI001EDD8F88|nr:hypothetical protein [Dactylosporangium sp. AC04546]WVK88846.1 hypothetical protein KZZ52_26630 [Dactylosporangium sp. AC04546]